MSKSIDFEVHYKNWQSSGLSKAGYCRQEDLDYPWFIYHCKRLNETHKGFSRLTINQNTGINHLQGIEFHQTDGSYFVFPVGCPVGVIRQLIG